MTDIKVISLKQLIFNSGRYFIRKWHEMAIFSIVNAIFAIIGFKMLNGWHDKFFLLWLFPYYMFLYYFFRFYFGRKPYITFQIFDTLLPSTLILVFTLIFMTLLIVIPLMIPFIVGNTPWVETYIEHLQRYTEGDHVLDLGMILILTLISPIIFYRPMMAWIDSVIGRSGKLSTAFAKTKGNYWRFIAITIIFNLPLILIDFCDSYFGLSGWLNILLASPILIFMNVTMAKMYENFFLAN